MKPKAIRIKKRSVAKLLSDVDGGRFAIPHLQREFVWDGPKAAKLLDSIHRGMPIGVVLIWETNRSQRLHLRQKYHILPAFNHKNRKVWFLIDGQQRVSVLFRTREGNQVQNARRRDVDFSRVVLALKPDDNEQIIRYRRAVPGEFVPLSVVLHPQWHKKLGELGKRQLTRVRDCRDKILKYQMFTMFVHGTLPQTREAFLRINTQGMKVTSADAIFTRAETLDLRDVVHEAREHLDENFKDIPDPPLLFLLAAVRGGTDVRGRAIETTISRLNKEAISDKRLRSSLAKDWTRLGTCIGKAVDYLSGHFCVVSREFLASDYILSLLAYFYFLNGRGPSPRQAKQIRRWFWATCVGSRYSGRDFNRCVPDDLKFFKKLAKNPGVQFKHTPHTERIDVRKAQFASHTALTSAVYCMLMRRGPVYLLDKGLNEIPIIRYSTRANRKDRHHIFARQVMANEQVPAKQYNSVANVCLLVAEENQRIGFQRPRHYLGNLKEIAGFKAKMKRHLIPVADAGGVWDSNLKRGFLTNLERRTELICDALEEDAGIRLFRREIRRQ